MIFAGHDYEGGGMRDFIDDFDTLEEAKTFADSCLARFVDGQYATELSCHDWTHVYDTIEREQVYENSAEKA